MWKRGVRGKGWKCERLGGGGGKCRNMLMLREGARVRMWSEQEG